MKIFDPIQIEGIAFSHVETDKVESYHYSGVLYFWEIFRHRQGEGRISREWFAVRFQKGTNLPTMLNTAIGDNNGGFQQKDPLFDVDAEDPKKLLTALATMIHEREGEARNGQGSNDAIFVY